MRTLEEGQPAASGILLGSIRDHEGFIHERHGGVIPDGREATDEALRQLVDLGTSSSLRSPASTYSVFDVDVGR
jgi:hypothetical protein